MGRPTLASERPNQPLPADGPDQELVPAAPLRGEARLSPALNWLFEGRGFLQVTLLVDAFLLLAALVLADAINPAPSHVPAFLVSPLTVALLAMARLYDPHAQIARLDRVARIVGATALAAVVIAGIVELYRPAAVDAGLIAIQLMLGAGLLVIWRSAWSTARLTARRSGLCGRPTLIVGAGEVGARLERHLRARPQIGLIPAGFIDADPISAVEIERRHGGVLGPPSEFDAIVDRTDARHAIFAFQLDPDLTLRPLLRRCRERGLGVAIVPRLFDDVTSRMVLESVGGVPVFELREVNPKGWQFAIKYGLDRLGASLLLVLLAPVLLGLALAVRISSGSPILFRQRRLGLDGQEFELIKFRSMSTSPAGAALPSTHGDKGPSAAESEDRLTSLGGALRRWNLDELPQLINVLRGEMSLVGPRPERPELAGDFAGSIRRYDERHRVRSGITGWAQVNGLVQGTSLADRAEWDNWYIQNWSFWLDFKILLMTIPAALRRTE